MSFETDVAGFGVKVQQRAQDIHNGVCDLAFSSIVEGSPVTGAPGQPVGGNQPGHSYVGGNLKGSWQNVPEGPLTRVIMTNVIYAPQIEDGTRGGRALTLWSAVGGWHSVALTRAGWGKIVETVTAEVVGNG